MNFVKVVVVYLSHGTQKNPGQHQCRLRAGEAACYNHFMAEITKQDVKNAVIEALEPFAKSVQSDFQGINKRLDEHDAAFAGINKRLDEHDAAFAGINKRLDDVEADVKYMKDNFSELFTKLDRFITLYEKQEMEHLSLAHQLARLEERVSKLEAGR